MEKDLASLKGSSAVKDDVGKVRAEMKKVYVSASRQRELVWTTRAC